MGMNEKECCTVFVELLGEGVDVWRPVAARKRDDGYELKKPPDYDPADEQWRFPPGSIVRVEERDLNGRSVLAAISPVAP